MESAAGGRAQEAVGRGAASRHLEEEACCRTWSRVGGASTWSELARQCQSSARARPIELSSTQLAHPPRPNKSKSCTLRVSETFQFMLLWVTAREKGAA